VGKTSIEWTDVSWPIVNGCRRASPGCEGCYAERLAATRLRHTPKYEGLATFSKGGPRWTGLSRLWEAELEMPLRLRDPSRIFVADMGDLFYEGVPDEVIDRVWAVMLLAPRHTFQVLTKRAVRARKYLSDPRLYERVLREADAIRAKRPALMGVGISNPATTPAPWIWVGVSVEDQARANERLPHLVETPAAVKFVSAEPLLGPVDLSIFLYSGFTEPPHPDVVNWVIVGGESGPKARALDVAWAESLIEQCRRAKTPVFMKQMGPYPEDDGETHPQKHPKGGDPLEWPKSLRVREFPEPRTLLGSEMGAFSMSSDRVWVDAPDAIEPGHAELQS